MAQNKVFIIGEFPVFHRGYLDFLKEKADEKNKSVFFIGLLDNEIIKSLTLLEPDIRKISQDDAKRLIGAYFSPQKYFVLKEDNLLNVLNRVKPDEIIILRGEKSEDFCHKYLVETSFSNIVRFYDVRLKWPSSKVYTAKKETPGSQNILPDELKTHKKFLKEAIKESEKSNCWWRQIGAILVEKNDILLWTHNRMLPHSDECYKIGCIRDKIPPGKQPEICSAVHAEANLVSQAAKRGVSLDGLTLYVTHFPCPVCAKIIALSGIKKLIYCLGSSVFDGERVMLSYGVEIVKLDL